MEQGPEVDPRQYGPGIVNKVTEAMQCPKNSL